MYDILFLSRTIPAEMDSAVRSKMSNTMDDAAIAWQHHIISGIEANTGTPVRMLNYLPVKSYPQHYRDAFVKGLEFAHVEGAKDINLPFCNIKYIKRLFQGRSLYRETKKWAKSKTDATKVIVAYTLYPEYLKAIQIAKKADPDITAIAIVLDLPEYSVLSSKMSAYTRLYLRWSKAEADKRIGCIDSFVLLTKQMATALAISKPFCVVEGICSEHFPAKVKADDGLKRIFYAGTLHRRFGVLKLLKAFQAIEDTSCRLVICGYGDSEDEIKAAAAADSRIEFKGQLHRKDALALMAQADVVVNPRGNDEEFTKYSFPSKNIEALSSGIPFIAYKLDGIPDEYDEYINYPTDDSYSALAALITEVCRDEDGTYDARAKKAQGWVLEHKNPRTQAKKLLDLI